MNYLQPCSFAVDENLVTAWESQALTIPELLSSRPGDLFRRFTAAYADIRKLPRGSRRALQRRLARSHDCGISTAATQKLAASIAGAALLLALSNDTQAATITVNTNIATIAADGKCSLVEAIINANYDNQSGSTECLAGSGADIIMLAPKSTHSVASVYGYMDQTNLGLPPITTTITIEGNGAKIRRVVKRGGVNTLRLFTVTGSGDLTLNNVTLSGAKAINGGAVANSGHVALNSCIVTGNIATFYGGGLWNEGVAEVTDTVFSKNQAYGYGGALFNDAGGTLNINNATITGNRATGRGGGVYNRGPDGELNISGGSVVKNSTGLRGGGVLNEGTAVLSNSTIVSGNKAYYGGGFFNGNDLDLDGVVVTKNSATIGGGIYNAPYSASLMIENGTQVTGNKAPLGGGITNLSYFQLVSSTITANSATVGGGVFNLSVHSTGTFFNATYSTNVPIIGNKAKLGPNVYNLTYTY